MVELLLESEFIIGFCSLRHELVEMHVVPFLSFTLVRLIFLPSSLLVCIRWHQLTNLSCPWQDSVEAFRWDTIWNKIVVLNVVIFVLEGFKGQDLVETKFGLWRRCGVLIVKKLKNLQSIFQVWQECLKWLGYNIVVHNEINDHFQQFMVLVRGSFIDHEGWQLVWLGVICTLLLEPLSSPSMLN